MNNLMKYSAYAIGAMVLISGAFFLFAALSGTPMSEMKGVGGAFPEAQAGSAVAGMDQPRPQDELESDRRSKSQVLREAVSPLKAFLYPAPFSGTKLAELEQALEQRMSELDMRDRDLDERESTLEQDRQLYDDLFTELEVLRTSLLQQDAETRARGEELDARDTALEAHKRTSYATLAKTFYGEDAGEAETLAPMLTAYSPEDAALILVALPGERAAALVTSVLRMDPQKAKGLQDAYMAVSAGAPAK